MLDSFSSTRNFQSRPHEPGISRRFAPTTIGNNRSHGNEGGFVINRISVKGEEARSLRTVLVTDKVDYARITSYSGCGAVWHTRICGSTVTCSSH